MFPSSTSISFPILTSLFETAIHAKLSLANSIWFRGMVIDSNLEPVRDFQAQNMVFVFIQTNMYTKSIVHLEPLQRPELHRCGACSGVWYWDNNFNLHLRKIKVSWNNTRGRGCFHQPNWFGVLFLSYTNEDHIMVIKYSYDDGILSSKVMTMSLSLTSTFKQPS